MIKHDIDMGYDELVEAIEEGGGQTDIGLLVDDVPNPTPSEIVNKRGLNNEFGVPEANIPERPAHRNAFDENVEEYIDDIEDHIDGSPENWDFGEMLDELGQKHTNNLIDEITRFDDPPNADFTVQKKGFDDPLIETLEMLGHVDYRVTQEED